jgi:anti-sigma regulatory factor (Ser/Thr protein kinase)
MGFTIMQTFMSDFKVESVVGKGTTVSMSKTIGLGKKEDA